jgi:hypothetical protein
MAEVIRNTFFQKVAVVAPEGITNPYSNGPTEFIFISWYNFHVRESHATRPPSVGCLNTLSMRGVIPK